MFEADAAVRGDRQSNMNENKELPDGFS